MIEFDDDEIKMLRSSETKEDRSERLIFWRYWRDENNFYHWLLDNGKIFIET